MMKIFVSGIIGLSLIWLSAYAEEAKKPVKIITFKSQKHETLGAFEKLIWETDMDHAFELAKRENKNVMIMVEDRHCKWCKNIKVGALSDPRVQKKLKSYILLKVQRSDKKTAERIVDFSGAIPSFYFMEPNQELIESVVGYYFTEDFLGYLNDIEEDN